jgi:hypothetical protein
VACSSTTAAPHEFFGHTRCQSGRFHLSERRRLQFRAELFNAVNHPNFQGNAIQRQFDRAGAGLISAANASRQIQFALKLTY